MKSQQQRLTPAALAAAAAGNLDNFIAASTPGGIEAQEKAGQTTFVANATLPQEGLDKAAFERMGFKIGEPVDGIFVSVTMPAGWSKKATDHSMWSDLVDDKGRKRAGIFYKAAFYDRKAHIGLNRRYGIDPYIAVNEAGEPVEYGKHTHLLAAVTDCDKPIHRIGVYPKDDYKQSDEMRKEGAAWLAERFQNYNDPTAYWE